MHKLSLIIRKEEASLSLDLAPNWESWRVNQTHSTIRSQGWNVWMWSIKPITIQLLILQEFWRRSKQHLMLMMKTVELGICIHRLITACSKSPDSDPHKIASKQLTALKPDCCLLRNPLCHDNTCLLKHEEQLYEFKKDVRTSLLPLDLEDEDEVLQLQSTIEKTILIIH